MRFSIVPLLGLALAISCEKTSPLAPGDAGPSFAKHQTEHTDSRDGEFEIRGFEGCFGELVVVTGTLRFKEHTVTSTETGNVDHSSPVPIRWRRIRPACHPTRRNLPITSSGPGRCATRLRSSGVGKVRETPSWS